MKHELVEHLNKVRESVFELDRILTLQEYSSDPRSVAVTCLLYALNEHIRSTLQLIISGATQSAMALIRATVDGMYCGLWISACATPTQIRAFEDEDASPLVLPEITAAVDTAFEANPLFKDVKNRCGNPLYKSNRLGIVQLGRWAFDSNAGLRSDERELCDATTTATVCILFLAAQFLANQNHPIERQEVETLAADFAKNSG